MSKIDTNDLVDIFKEEVTKKAKKELKKQLKKEKKLEKKEEKEFQKIAKEHDKKKQTEIETTKQLEKEKIKNEEIKKLERTRRLDPIKEVKKSDEELKNESVLSFLYDTTFGFFLILLLFCAVGFIGIQLSNSSNTKEILKMICLGGFVIFYILSATIKNNGFKKFTTIFTSAFICAWMILTLYFS